ncbi:MAG TPA: hypothetical protein VLL82_14940 [Mycobacterium sp.]|nr:hypothetical protein [Mycobacterium sp.]
MSKGLGDRQRTILARLAIHRDEPWTRPNYNRMVRYRGSRRGIPAEGDQVTLRHADGTAWILGAPEYVDVPESMRDRYPEWVTISELARGTNLRTGEPSGPLPSDVESTRRAVHTLEAAGLVETRMIRRRNRGPLQLGVRLKRDQS